MVNNFYSNFFKNKIFKNFNANLYLSISLAIYQIISVPIFLERIGVNNYNIWLFLFSLPWYLVILDYVQSFNFSVANELVKSKEKNKKKLFNYLLKKIFTFNVYALILSSIIFIFFLYLFDLESIFNLNENSYKNLKLSAAFIFIFTFLNLFYINIETIFRVFGNYASGIKLTTSSKNIEYLFLFFSLFYFEIDYAIFFYLITRLLIIFFIFYYVFFKFNLKIDLSLNLVDFIKFFKINFQPSNAFLLHIGSTTLVIYFPIFLISFFFSSSMIVLFSLPRTISRLTIQFSSIICKAFYPEYSFLLAKDNSIKTLTKYLFFSNFIILIFNISIFLFLIFFAEDLLSIWTNGKVNLNKSFLFILMLTSFLHTLANSLFIVFTANNTHYFLSKIYFILILSSSFFAFLLCIFFDSFEVSLLPYMLSEFIFLLFCIIQINKIFKISKKDIFLSYIKIKN